MSENALGKVIKRLREERKLSKSRLAREAGISDAYVVQIEKGDRLTPSPDVLRRLARVLRVPPHDLLIPSGFYSPEEIRQAEESAMDQCGQLQQYRPDLDEQAQPDLFDRYLGREFDKIDYYNSLNADELLYETSELHELDLPPNVYWGWNKPLGLMPPENWEKLGDGDRRLAQKLINRLARVEDTEA